MSLSDDPSANRGLRQRAPIALSEIKTWLARVPALLIDGAPHRSPLQLRDRLAGFWLGDENVIYIGKATSLHSRVADYYATPLGNRGPHAGGRWAKTLSADIYVYFAETPRPEEYERALLKSFARGVSLESQQALHDPSSPIPFANLQFPRGAKKRHFVTRASVPRKR